MSVEASTYQERLDAAMCAQKRPLPNQWDAEEMAERHFSCPVCKDGRQHMSAYVCPTDPTHWHIGHQR